MDIDKVAAFGAEPLQHFGVYGWPDWPPRDYEVPDPSEWWKSGLVVYPEIVGTRLPNRSLVEVMGDSRTGKSDVLQIVSQKLAAANFQGVKYCIADEPIVSCGRFYQYAPYGPFLDLDFFPFMLKKEEAFDNVEIQLHKVLNLMAIAERYTLTSVHKTGIEGREIVARCRGSVDACVWMHAMLSYKGPDERFRISDEFFQLACDLMAFIVSNSQLYSRITDAVIVFGRGRPADVLQADRSGRGVSGSDFYDHLSRWYGFWVQEIYPRIPSIEDPPYRPKQGICVVDGTLPPEAKVEQVYNYLFKLGDLSRSVYD